MKITGNGVHFAGHYRSASIGKSACRFTDATGATLVIDTETLLSMADLCRFDLKRRGESDQVAGIQTSSTGINENNQGN